MALNDFEPGTYCMECERHTTEQKASSIVPWQPIIIYCLLKLFLWDIVTPPPVKASKIFPCSVSLFSEKHLPFSGELVVVLRCVVKVSCYFSHVTNVGFSELALDGFEPGTYCTEGERHSTERKGSLIALWSD